MRVLLLLGAALVIWGAACRGGDSSGAISRGSTPAPRATVEPACTTPRPANSGTESMTLESGGVERHYLRHVPASYSGTEALPLVIVFHPFAGNAQLMFDLTRVADVADAEGFVVVAPDGMGSPQFWNIAQYRAAADDVGFIRELISRIDADLCIDAGRTYATGYSNGGGMALRLACAMPERIAAVGVVASQYVACDAAVPLIAFHGSADQILPFEGGPDPDGPAVNLVPVRRAVSEWAQQLGCDGLAQITVPSSEVEVSTYQRCAGGTGEALLYTVLGGGHSWPGSTPLPESIVGRTTQQINATELIWRFFSAHSRRTP